MKKVIFTFLFFSSLNLFAQEVKPEERRFKVDTTALRETKNEFVLPEFVITGRETIEIESGQKIESNEINLPKVDLKHYEILHGEKISSDVSIKTWKDDYVKLSEESSVAKFKAGVGRYLTAYFDGMVQGKVFKGLFVNSNFYHRSSQGFIENADYIQNQFSIGAKFYLPQIRDKIFNWLADSKISSTMDYWTYSFGFYGSPVPSFHRNMNNLSLMFSLESPYRKSFDYDLRVRYSIFTVLDTIENYESSRFDGREKRFDFSFNFRRAVDFLSLRFNADYTSSQGKFFKLALFAGNLLEFFEIGRSYWLDFGVKLFSFKNSDMMTGLRIYPDVSFKYLAGKETQLYAFFAPEVLNLTIFNHLKANRFLTKNLNIVHPDGYFNFGFGVRYGKGGIGLDAGLNFRAFKNFPVYVEYKKGFYSVEFERVQFIELKGSGYLNYRRSEFIFGVILNSSYNARSKKPVPYYPNFSANLGYGYKFGFGLAINLEINLISSRVYNFEGDELKGFALANLRGEYEVFRNFKVFVNFDNLFAQRFYLWQSYLEPDIVVIGGVEYRF